MGGASKPIEDLAKTAMLPFTIGPSLISNDVADATRPGWAKDAAAPFSDPLGKKAANSAAKEAAEQNREMMAQQRDIQDKMLLAPKQISPDNFLAMKANQLANLRLGLASTITGAGGAPGAVLNRPTLTGNYPGKAKLGA